MEQQFKTHISSEHHLLDLHLRETFEYRDLIILMVKKSFTEHYKQTILGPLWALINPLLTTIVFTIIFGNLAQLASIDVTGDYIIPKFLFYMSGNICWNYFSMVLKATSLTFIDNRQTMGKVYYPRLVAPVSAALSRLISFSIQFAMFAVFWLFYVLRGGTSIRLTPMILLVPVLILQVMIMSTGFGIIISSVTTKYRDMALLVDFGLNLWRYGCPIAYGLLLVPQKYMNLYMLNPMTPVLTTFRYAVFGFGYFNVGYYALSWVITLAVFFLGLILFSRIERTFMDTI